MSQLCATAIENEGLLPPLIRAGKLRIPHGIRPASGIVYKWAEACKDKNIGVEGEAAPLGESIPAGRDVEAVLEMSREFYATTKEAKHVPMCDVTVRKLIAKCSDSVLLIAEHEGEAVGFIACIFADWMYNSAYTSLHEVAWYIKPEFRDMGYGKKLLISADMARKALGCFKLEKATLATSPKAAEDILLASGFELSYKSFMKVG